MLETSFRKVILEGCNGEWAQESYLPALIRKAAGEEIELWAVDIEGEIKLSSPKIEKDWRIAHSKNRGCYLNKSKDTENYGGLHNADYVFVVAPGRFHSEIAISWLDRLAPEGKIFIEKPLDASLGSALKLKEKIEEKEKVKESIFAFDHYLARAYPFLDDSAHYLKKIGGMEKIEFHVLEASGISPKREKTLDKGVIFDLVCHVLALVCAVVSRDLTCSAGKLQSVKLKGVKAARYTGCPISGETFAWIKFMVNNDIQVISVVGKCVANSEDKFMKLYGANGNITLDFVKDEFSVLDLQEGLIKQGKLNSKHVGTFLENVLQGGEYPLLIPGVVSFKTALDILKILDEAKKQIDTMPEYRCNESISEILGRF